MRGQMEPAARIACYRTPSPEGTLDRKSSIEYAAHPAIFFHAERYRGSRDDVRVEVMASTSIEGAMDCVARAPLFDSERVRWSQIRDQVAACATWWALEQLSAPETSLDPVSFEGIDVKAVLRGLQQRQPPPLRLIIAGTRTLTERPAAHALINWYIDSCLRSATSVGEIPHLPDEVVSGNESGGDSIGEEWAMARYIPVRHFPADWKGLGKRAGPQRNHKMGDHGTDLLAFHLDNSPGTANMIATMNKLKKSRYVFLEHDLARMRHRLEASRAQGLSTPTRTSTPFEPPTP